MATGVLIAALATLGALIVALGVAVWLLWREQQRMRFESGTARAVAEALRDGRDEDAIGELLGYLEAVHKHVERLAAHAREIDEAMERFRGRARSHLQRIGVVRFDASESVSGRLSCALCVLDGRGDGFLVTTLYDLERSRTFVHGVRGGRTERELLQPEREALEAATSAVPAADTSAPEDRGDAAEDA